jgi:Holliday junction DNA helicase RuvA
VKGVGKKTAERLVVELKDALGVADGGARGSGLVQGPLADAAAALVALGLDADEAGERLRRIPEAAALPVPELVRRALRTG